MSLFDVYKGIKLDAGIKIDDVLGEKYGIVDLGTLDWYYISASDWNCFTVSIADKAYGDQNLICAKYAYGTMYGTSTDKIICGNLYSNDIYIRDAAYNNAESFKTAVSGVYLVYEKEA